MDFRKISYKGGVVELAWNKANGQLQESGGLPAAKDEPRAAFKKALEALGGDFAYFMELTGFKGEAAVHGVSFGKTKGGGLTFKLLGGLKVGAGYSSLNTPTLYAPDPEVEAGEATLTTDQMARISKLSTLAEKYVNGDRRVVQAKMDLDDAEAPAEEPATA